jgi:6-phosphogluconolactonase (cycloisomerase 2 family)
MSIVASRARALALLLLHACLAQSPPSFTVLVGFASSDPVRVFSLDAASGALTPQANASGGSSFPLPAGCTQSGWIALSADYSRLFVCAGSAIAEANASVAVEAGGVTGLSLAFTSRVVPVDAPVHASVSSDGSLLLTVSYNVGTYSTLDLRGGGLALATTRPACMRAHQVLALARDAGAGGGDNVLVPCLGSDSVRTDTALNSGCAGPFGTVCNGSAGPAMSQPRGGPRHLALHPTLPVAFLVNELDSTLATWLWSPSQPQLSSPVYVSTLPP